jgi:hypothetical protein
VTATYTFDIFCTLDGYGSFSGGDWGGYWGKQGPEFLDHRLAVSSGEQRMVLGANTFRQFLQLLGPVDESELDPVNMRMRRMPTTVVSTTLAGPFEWPDATLFPVITGQTGTDPIFQGAADFDLELIESRTFDGHIQELVYRPTLH